VRDGEEPAYCSSQEPWAGVSHSASTGCQFPDLRRHLAQPRLRSAAVSSHKILSSPLVNSETCFRNSSQMAGRACPLVAKCRLLGTCAVWTRGCGWAGKPNPACGVAILSALLVRRLFFAAVGGLR
jgi:hypothetical protein